MRALHVPAASSGVVLSLVVFFIYLNLLGTNKMASCSPADMLTSFTASTSYAVAKGASVRACTVSDIPQVALGTSYAFILYVSQLAWRNLSSVPSWTPSTALRVVQRSLGWPHVGALAALLCAFVAFVWIVLRLSLKILKTLKTFAQLAQENARLRQEKAQLAQKNARLQEEVTEHQERIRELTEDNAVLNQQLDNMPHPAPADHDHQHQPAPQAANHQQVADSLGLTVGKRETAAPLINYAASVPRGNMVLAQGFVEQADVSGVYSMQVLRSFDDVYGCGKPLRPNPKGQAVAQHFAAALLVVMLRRLAVDQTLRREFRALLLPAVLDQVGTVNFKWSTLNRKLFETWDARHDALLRRAAGEELQFVRYKYTAVAAVQMLALLMHHGCVVA